VAVQTKREIQQLLADAGIRPNKRLGQHFLIDLNLMRLLVESADIGSTDLVLEVGCGTGSLTEALAERACKVVAVEIDRILAEIAARQLGSYRNVEVINRDILANKNRIDPYVTQVLERARQQCGGQLLLVANLPYNAASSLMMNLVEGPVIADAMFVTVQKEVAKRMTASPGGSEYGSLGILLGATGDTEMVRALPASVFWPQPRVESAMVSFVRDHDKAMQIEDISFLSDVIGLFIGHRRKTLKACVRFASGRLARVKNWQDVFDRCSIDPTCRPQQLSPTDYVIVANICQRLVGKT